MFPLLFPCVSYVRKCMHMCEGQRETSEMSTSIEARCHQSREQQLGCTGRTESHRPTRLCSSGLTRHTHCHTWFFKGVPGNPLGFSHCPPILPPTLPPGHSPLLLLSSTLHVLPGHRVLALGARDKGGSKGEAGQDISVLCSGNNGHGSTQQDRRKDTGPMRRRHSGQVL